MKNKDQEVPKQEELLDFYQKLRQKIRDSLSKVGDGSRSELKTIYSRFVGYLAALPDLFHLGVKLLFDGSVPAENKGALLAALAYVVSPIDIIPDTIPIAGWVDDLIVMTMAINKLLDTSDPAVSTAVERHWAGEADVFATAKHVIEIVDEAAEFLPKKLIKLVKDMFPRPSRI